MLEFSVFCLFRVPNHEVQVGRGREVYGPHYIPCKDRDEANHLASVMRNEFNREAEVVVRIPAMKGWAYVTVPAAEAIAREFNKRFLRRDLEEGEIPRAAGKSVQVPAHIRGDGDEDDED